MLGRFSHSYCVLDLLARQYQNFSIDDPDLTSALITLGARALLKGSRWCVMAWEESRWREKQFKKTLDSAP
jgi:hypothetical protein